MKNIYSRKQTGHVHIKIAILITAISISNIIAFVFHYQHHRSYYFLRYLHYYIHYLHCHYLRFIFYNLAIFTIITIITWFLFSLFFFLKKLLILLDSAALRLRDFTQYFELHNFFSKLSIWIKFVFYILFYQIH